MRKSKTLVIAHHFVYLLKKMANHTDFDDEIIETWEELYGGQNSGELTVSYQNVSWRHKAFMNKIGKSKKIITEDIDEDSELNEVHEYFR